MRNSLAAACLLIGMGLGSGGPAIAADGAPSLSLPLDCTLGKDCFIQQYVDADPGPGVTDYRCGIASYPSHDGVDFRVLSVKAAEAGVTVLASAGGRVKGLRDGVNDRLVATPQDENAVENRECGNGVVIDHGGGWETQYCHMRRGSVKVRGGQTVTAGTPLGLVGYSGRAQFAHVHLSVRLNGMVVDPFPGNVVTRDAMTGNASVACQQGDALPPSTLWAAPLREQLAYRNAQIIQTGFAAKPVLPGDVEQGGISAPLADSPALVFFARAINMRIGDAMRISIEGPGGFQAASEGKPLDAAKAQFVGFAGNKLSGERWPPGEYRGSAEIVRAGTIASQTKDSFVLP